MAVVDPPELLEPPLPINRSERAPIGPPPPGTSARMRWSGTWWRWNAVLAGVVVVGFAAVALADLAPFVEPGTDGWWIAAVAVHLPWWLLVVFLVGGLVERLGYFAYGRRPSPPGRLPQIAPKVCVQLPMFNESDVARRIVEAAAALRWPTGRLEIQVLDDSTESESRHAVDAICAELAARGVDISVLRREQRDGYKAGALEAGRQRTDAELIAIFDADFLPPVDFLERAVPHFFDADGRSHPDLALVQTQWGHLNHDESMLTRAQSLWVDDHHTIQMSWRAAKWNFVNFTGTAGIWRADAVERAGGWRAASLVEDCELSFRHLFAGYRTTFIKEIVAPAELPATYTAYKAQQRRWTQGWVQLQRLHLRKLLYDYDTTPLRRLHLLYHMCIANQWALWAAWLLVLPFLIETGFWFGAIDPVVGLIAYLAPTTIWLLVMAVIASIETRHTYREGRTPAVVAGRMARLVPYVAINAGMLPHQFSAFTEGLFGPLHTEFERTPKLATVTESGARPDHAATRASATRRPVRVHGPYVAAEVFFVVVQVAWAARFALDGGWVAAAGSIAVATCVAGLMWFYGDHVGRRLFLFPARGGLRVDGTPGRSEPGAGVEPVTT